MPNINKCVESLCLRYGRKWALINPRALARVSTLTRFSPRIASAQMYHG